jgi:hypothetical protein
MTTEPADGGAIVITQAVLDAMPEAWRQATAALLYRAGLPGLADGPAGVDATGVTDTVHQAAAVAAYLQVLAGEARDRAATGRMEPELATAVIGVAGDQRASTEAWRSLAAVLAPEPAAQR